MGRWKRLPMHAAVVGLALLGVAARVGGATAASRSVAPAGGVTVELVEQGVPLEKQWPTHPGPAAESYEETAFGFFHEPWRYISTGVREDRPSPHLFRAKARVTLPAGSFRVLLRARGPARLTVDGQPVVDLPFPPERTDGHNPIRHDFLELGPETRYRAAGDHEAVADHQSTGAPREWVLETLVGGRAGKEPLRPELGETLVAVAAKGSDRFHLLSPARRVPLTDPGWEAYRAEREAHYRRVEAGRRAVARLASADYWAMRHTAARDWVKQHPAPLPPPAGPATHPIDRFLEAQLKPTVRNAASGASPSLATPFDREIRPLLKARCLNCHASTASGGLRLDSAAAARKGGASGRPAIAPGHPEASTLIARVAGTSAEHRMPPGPNPLTPAEIARLTEWIRRGATWTDDPVVAVRPSPLIDDPGFLRRVTLDLTGTVPTLTEARAFLADRRPDRRARLIDRLLDDPRWADPWVAYWQDLLAENPNLVNSTLNNTGPFRWWLYESFLDRKPLDLMVTELIRMEGSRFGGGPAGFGLAAMNDAPLVAKANILGTALLATEMKCARCHDAPYHASKQSDLFNLAAMLARAPVAVPITSSVPSAKLGGRTPRIKVTLQPGEKVPPHWSLESLARNEFPNRWLAQPDDTRDRLAALITAPWNERFAEVMVNRVWRRYMGRGLVEPLHDWENARPSHPTLLKWLAREFVGSGYDLRHLSRLILTSRAYQRQSRTNPEANRLFAAPPRRRLSAEQVVDSSFDAFGRKFDVEPLCIDLDGARPPINGLNFGKPRRAWEFVYSSNERDRPSLTLPRNEAVTELLLAFGWTGSRQDAQADRRVEPMAIQPALLANGTVSRWLTRLSDDSRLTALCLQNRPIELLVEDLFLGILTRKPTDEERRAVISVLKPGYATRVNAVAAAVPARKPQPYVAWSNHLDPEATDIRIREAAEARQGPPPTRRLTPAWRERMEDVLWTLLNLPERVYVP